MGVDEQRTIPIPPAQTAPPIAVSPAEAATMLSLSRAAFYNHIMPFVRIGHIRSIRVGRSIRILVKSLNEWAEAQANK